MTAKHAGGATPAHQRLEIFAGKWRTEGQTAPGPSGPATRFAGTDAYEWLEGGHFMVHHVDVMMGDAKVIVIEIIGYDAANDAYPMHSYDSQGNVEGMQASVRNGIWTIQGNGVRCTVTPGEDGNVLTGKWERNESDAWQPWMDVQLTRIT